ncbi:hypothetical protein F5Y17DRAFT_461357 [Xylariaceae sp. FL0594]|nr:hypothetical protein F5Y17DRAFT_461357 [Xylariaceae sp. FL0594]
MSTSSTSTTGSSAGSSSSSSSRLNDTGFPESFAAFTTSRRHPDARVDPGFAISSEHIDPARTLKRSQTSLLRKHRRTTDYGKIPKNDGPQTNLSALASGSSSSVMLGLSSKDRNIGVQELAGASKMGKALVIPTQPSPPELNRRGSKVFRRFKGKK